MRTVFFSFCYDDDYWRTNQIRHIGSISGDEPVKSNEWEEIKRGGERAIRNWIDGQLAKCDCLVVLIGENTAFRPWVRYEIEQAWKMGLGVTGIYIDRLKNARGEQSRRGPNPMQFVSSGNYWNESLINYVFVHSPASYDSQEAYAEIARSIGVWVESAITQRKPRS